MQSIILQEKSGLVNFFANAQSIGIVVGVSGSAVDSQASALSFSLSLKNSGKSTQIVSLIDPTVEVSHLVGIDQVGKEFSGNAKVFTISVPYREGEIDKVSYNIEKDRLNVNLFAQTHGVSFSEKDIEYIRKGDSPSSIICIGVDSKNELSQIAELKDGVKILQIDTFANERFGDIAIIDSSYSSLSEIVTEILYELALPMDLDISQNLLDGIVSATNNFTIPQTSMFAFQSAGLLMQQGAVRRGVSTVSLQEKDSFPEPEMLLKKDRFSRKDVREFLGVQKPQKFPVPPKEESPFKSPEEVPTGEGVSSSEDIPNDWFLPKVFKGSKKGN